MSAAALNIGSYIEILFFGKNTLEKVYIIKKANYLIGTIFLWSTPRPFTMFTKYVGDKLKMFYPFFQHASSCVTEKDFYGVEPCCRD
jgi:hypothetical protein